MLQNEEEVSKRDNALITSCALGVVVVIINQRFDSGLNCRDGAQLVEELAPGDLGDLDWVPEEPLHVGSVV